MSSLSANAAVTPEAFREVLGFLIGFISKDKQTESMTEKLCHRFGTSDAPQHHRDIAFCVAALAHTEKSVRKLIELHKTFADKLADDEVAEAFGGLVQRARKGFTKPELKTALDEFEALLQGSAEEGGGGEEGAPRPAAAAAKPPAKPSARKKGRAAAKKKKEWEEDEEDDGQEDGADDGPPAAGGDEDEAGENVAPASNRAAAEPAAAASKAGRAARGRSGRKARA